MAAHRTLGFMALALAALVADGAAAQERRFGDWTVGVIDDRSGLFAATVNDSGGMLGQYCFQDQGSCVWVLSNDVGCDAGNRYPVLVNADTGAASLEILCVQVEGKARYAFTDFDTFDGIARRARRVGVAFPMRNGLFQVSRFSLDGAARAVAAMRELAEAMARKASGSTRDQTF